MFFYGLGMTSWFSCCQRSEVTKGVVAGFVVLCFLRQEGHLVPLEADLRVRVFVFVFVFVYFVFLSSNVFLLLTYVCCACRTQY